jgi:hypothetical protein
MPSALVGLASLAATLLTAATQCPPGQKADAKTPDKCCFPGQSWSKTELKCTGTPQCPAGMTVAGDRCIEAVPNDPSNYAPFPSAAPADQPLVPPPPTAPRPTYQPMPVPQQPRGQWIEDVWVPTGYHLETRPRGSLYGPGIGLFAGGFFFALVSTFGALTDYGLSRNPCANWAAETNWIPLAGPLINVVGQQYIYYGLQGCNARGVLYPAGVAIAVIETVLQAGGITMFVLGLTVKEKVAVPDSGGVVRASPKPELYVGLGAPGSLAGLSARLIW